MVACNLCQTDRARSCQPRLLPQLNRVRKEASASADRLEKKRAELAAAREVRTPLECRTCDCALQPRSRPACSFTRVPVQAPSHAKLFTIGCNALAHCHAGPGWDEAAAGKAGGPHKGQVGQRTA